MATSPNGAFKETDMATLVLTAVGSAIGGPIGGAIGAFIGQQIDAEIFAPPARQGSRLKELAVQTSSYGSQIPGIFGAMRVAGTVIWSTDLIEQRTKSGGGKGRPSTVNYSYRVSLAVALSSRPIAHIGRIWADGNLIRGVNDDLKIDAQMRVHEGQENQRPDPLLASAEAHGQCPAHRGIAYVVFEDLQLAEFGNRIPSFTFEIFERDEPLALSALLTTVSNGDIATQSGLEIIGFAVAGASVREAVAPILDSCPLELVVCDSHLVIRDVGVQQDFVHSIDIVVEENGRALEKPKHAMPPAADIPVHVSLRYYDAERDYQAGIQQSNSDAGGRGDMRLELPAVLSAGAAKAIVEAKDSDVRYASHVWSGAAAASGGSYRPGDHFRTADNRKWQISEVEVGLGTTHIKAKALPKYMAIGALASEAGRHVPSADQPIGQTRIMALDMPLVPGGDPHKPALALFAAGTEAGWKRAAISLSTDDQWTDFGTTALPAVMGNTQNAMGAHHPFLLDKASMLDIVLLHAAMNLATRDTSPLAVDAPIFWIDGEFVRVGRIVALGGKSYRLSRFSRAVSSSVMHAPAHAAGAQIVLIDAPSTRIISENAYQVGQTVTLDAQGLGDVAPVTTVVVAEGMAITPLPPVHGRVVKDGSGNFDLYWKRRSRLDLGWVGGVDQAQAEDQESYRVGLYIDDGMFREWTVTENYLHISASEMEALGVLQNSLIIFKVQQIGRFAQSGPLTLGLN
jgi:hypothetical protein